MSGVGASSRTPIREDKWPVCHELLPKGQPEQGKFSGSDPAGSLGGRSCIPEHLAQIHMPRKFNPESKKTFMTLLCLGTHGLNRATSYLVFKACTC